MGSKNSALEKHKFSTGSEDRETYLSRPSLTAVCFSFFSFIHKSPQIPSDPVSFD